MNDIIHCPICGYENIGKFFVEIRIDGYECPICGRFAIPNPPWNDFLNDPEFRKKAPSIAASRKLNDMDGYVLITKDNMPDNPKDLKINFTPIDPESFLSEYPRNNAEIFDIVLLNLGRLSESVMSIISIKPNVDKYILYAQNTREVRIMLTTLKEMGYISGMGINPEVPKNELIEICKARLTPKGWQRIKELEDARAFEHSDKAFLAMWFDDKTKPLRRAIKEAVERAGYNPEDMIVDETRHTDYIMNKVLNMIDDARFVIADFTCAPEDHQNIKNGVRGGVYFEAGYARGQGKTVIHTCRNNDDSKKRLHFDIQQIVTSRWDLDETGKEIKDREKFIDDLAQTIMASVGRGPRYHKK